MSDNVSELPVLNENRLKKKIIWMSGILLVVCLIVLAVVFWDELNFDKLTRKIKYLGVTDASEGAIFQFDAHNGNCYADSRDGLVVGSISGLSVFSKNGALKYESQASADAPAVQVSDENILYYDAGGFTFMMTDSEGKTLLSETTSGGILDADISQDGYACYCAPAAGLKTELCVYNNSGSLMYRYKSASRYLPLCTVSKQGKYAAAAAFSQLDGAFQSFAVVFALNQQEPVANIALGNQLIFDIEFMPDQTLVCIGEDSVRWIQPDGTLLCSYHYADSYFKDFSTSGDGFLTLCLNTNKAGNHYSLVTVDETGTELGNLTIEEEILDFSASGKYVAVLTAQSLNVYNKKMELYASTDQIAGFTHVLMRKDGSVLAVGSDEASVFIP